MKKLFSRTNVLAILLIMLYVPSFADGSNGRNEKFDSKYDHSIKKARGEPKFTIGNFFTPEQDLCTRDLCRNYYERRKEYSDCIRKNKSLKKDMYETTAQFEDRKAKAEKDCESLHIDGHTFWIEKDVKRLKYVAEDEYFVFKLRQNYHHYKRGYLKNGNFSMDREPRNYEADSFVPKTREAKWRFHSKDDRWMLCYTAYPKGFKDLPGERWIFTAYTELYNHQYFTGSYSAVNDEPTAGRYYKSMDIMIYLDSPINEARKFSVYEDSLKFIIHGNIEISDISGGTSRKGDRKEIVTFLVSQIDLINDETNEKISSTFLHATPISSNDSSTPKFLREGPGKFD